MKASAVATRPLRRRAGQWLLAACFASIAGPGMAQPPAGVTVRDDRGVEHRLPAPPQRIVSLLPSLTETVCALQACNRLVGVDQFSNWPASVAALPKLGGIEDTQIERLVSLKPDLVLLAGSARAIDRLEGLGLRVLVLEPKTLPDAERVIHLVARALGDTQAGLALWQSIQGRLQVAAARVPPALRGKKVYFEAAGGPYAASEASFVGELLTRLGMANVVPASLGPFPKLNPEYVLRAQPDIVMATARSLAEMPSRPGWDGLRALRDKRQCGFAPAAWDTLVRAGPRLAEAAEVLADCLAGLERAPRAP